VFTRIHAALEILKDWVQKILISMKASMHPWTIYMKNLPKMVEKLIPNFLNPYGDCIICIAPTVGARKTNEKNL